MTKEFRVRKVSLDCYLIGQSHGGISNARSLGLCQLESGLCRKIASLSRDEFVTRLSDRFVSEDCITYTFRCADVCLGHVSIIANFQVKLDIE